MIILIIIALGIFPIIIYGNDLTIDSNINKDLFKLSFSFGIV